MNDRIKELANQAGFASDKLGNLFGGDEIEKFAELVIKECAKVAWRHTPDYEELDYSHLISNKIKEHFGLE